MEIQIKQMDPLGPNNAGKKTRQSKYRLGELEVGEGFELPDNLGTVKTGPNVIISKRLNQLRSAVSNWSKRNPGPTFSVALRENRRGEKMVAVRRDT